jgi:hypothetical protein
MAPTLQAEGGVGGAVTSDGSGKAPAWSCTKKRWVKLGAQPTEEKGRAALTDERCSGGAASSEETAVRWCSTYSGLWGPKTGSGATAGLLRRQRRNGAHLGTGKAVELKVALMAGAEWGGRSG